MIEKSAILHIPMSQYAYGIDENRVTIRLRCKHDDLDECVLYYGDRACRLTPVIFSEQKMVKVIECERFDYYEAVLEKPYKRLNYYFKLISGDENWLYYGDCFMKDTVDDRSEYYQLPFNHRDDIVKPPLWAKNAVIYNIFPDSFATSKSYISKQSSEQDYKGNKVRGKLGGTLKGITENVDYLKRLGVNAIYINPIFAAGEYHKYDLLDYYQVDPCFGTNEDLKELVDVYHKNGLKVIIDGVFNHCGWNFFAFDDVVKNGTESKYKDWFYDLKFPVIKPENPEEYPNYECFGYERMMPKLNMANPETAEYFCEVGKYWIREFGIDGWRLDVASEVNDDFWRKFSAGVRQINPDAILIGEVWETANHWLDGKIFDSTMNYDFRKHCNKFFAEKSIDAAEFGNRVADMYMRYRKQTTFAQLNLLDSHDVGRFLSACDGDVSIYKLAVLFQMTFPGMPSIFYGDEMGLEGIIEADYRRPMDWESKPGKLFEFFQKVIRCRLDNEVLRLGDFRIVSAKSGERVFGYERYLGESIIRIYLNVSDEPVDIEDIGDVGDSTVLIQEGYTNHSLDSHGYIVFAM